MGFTWFNLNCYIVWLGLKATVFNGFLQAAIISLGLVGAGTNNARIAGMLRKFSSFYYIDPRMLFCVMLLFNAFSCSSLPPYPIKFMRFLCRFIDMLWFFSVGANCSRSCILGEGPVDS